jgi:hypothetical protein
MKMAAFWDVAPRNLIDIDRRFGGGYYLHHQGETAFFILVAVRT